MGKARQCLAARVAVEIYKTSSAIYPVRALQKWWKAEPPMVGVGLPAFRKSRGNTMTARDVNRNVNGGVHLSYLPSGIRTSRLRRWDIGPPGPLNSARAGVHKEKADGVGHQELLREGKEIYICTAVATCLKLTID
jgi:hypothetical protein